MRFCGGCKSMLRGLPFPRECGVPRVRGIDVHMEKTMLHSPPDGHTHAAWRSLLRYQYALARHRRRRAA